MVYCDLQVGILSAGGNRAITQSVAQHTVSSRCTEETSLHSARCQLQATAKQTIWRRYATLAIMADNRVALWVCAAVVLGCRVSCHMAYYDLHQHFLYNLYNL